MHSLDENMMMLQMVQALRKEMAEMKMTSQKEVSEMRGTIEALEVTIFFISTFQTINQSSTNPHQKEIATVRSPPSPPSPPISHLSEESNISRLADRLTDRLTLLTNFSTPSLRPCTASRDFSPTTPVLNHSFSPRLAPASLKTTSHTSHQPANHLEHQVRKPSSPAINPLAMHPVGTGPEGPEMKGEERAKRDFLDGCENKARGKAGAGGEQQQSHFNTVREIRELNALYPRDELSVTEYGDGKTGKWERVKSKGKGILGKVIGKKG
jgi:hypothetical protein